MIVTVEADVEKYITRVRQWAALTAEDLGDALRDETRLLIRACISRTPPFSGRQLSRMLGDEGFADAGTPRAVGEAAVDRDIRRVYRPVSGLDIYKNEESVRRLVEEGNVEKVDQILKGSSKYAGTVTFPNGAFHRSQRDSRGRVRKGALWQAVMSPTSIDLYVMARQQRVGYAKSGWSTGARMFGVSIPGWIGRHGGQGAAYDHTRGTLFPQTMVANLVPWIQRAGRDLRVVSGAIEQRTKALQGKIRKQVNKSFLEAA